MDDMRRDVIEAFDQSQGELGDLQGVRERMLRGAYAGRSSRSDNALHLAAGIAAILIAALLIGTLAYIRAVSQPTPAHGFNVPDTTPLILYHDPAKVGQIDGITWDGRSSGRVGDGGNPGGTSNPAGTMYSTASDFRDRTGRVVGPLASDMPNAFHVTWADDELHYCQVVPALYKGVGPGPGMLQLVVPGGKVSDIAQIGSFGPASQYQPPPSGSLGGPMPQYPPPPTVVACSVENDRAVVSQAVLSPNTTSVRDWVVQLSTGRILWTHMITVAGSQTEVEITSTHDGQYVAESIASPAPASATIFGPDGSAITHLTATVDAFSWDGSLAVTSPDSSSAEYGGLPMHSARVMLIRWRDGTVVWTGQAGLPLRTARSEPGGTRIAIGLIANMPADPTVAPTINLYVVSADGRLVWSKNNVNLA
jgi:hypothetical protein